MSKSFIFDTETTGLLLPDAVDTSQQPYIIEIAVIVFEEPSFKILEEFETLIKPPIMISEKITQITKITNEDLEDKESFIHHYDALCDLALGCERIIGHNLGFDRGMLANELLRIDKLINFPWPKEHICTVESSIQLKGFRLSLDKLYKIATGKEIEGWHRALGDTQNALECYKWLRKKKKI